MSIIKAIIRFFLNCILFIFESIAETPPDQCESFKRNKPKEDPRDSSTDQQFDNEPELPYRSRDYLLSKGENAFFKALCKAINNQLHICVKPRMGDIFYVPNSEDGSHDQRCRNWINQKHVDFLLCLPDEMKPVLAIELDDKSHLRKERMSRDDFVDSVFRVAGSKILHIKAQSQYDHRELRRQIQKAIKG